MARIRKEQPHDDGDIFKKRKRDGGKKNRKNKNSVKSNINLLNVIADTRELLLSPVVLCYRNGKTADRHTNIHGRSPSC